METKQFLSNVLSDEGYYCVVGIKNNKTVQKFYDSLESLAESAVNLDTEGYDAYFALGTFVECTSRKADNVQQLKALFLDLDCGTGKPYATQHDALIALRGFYKKYDLPKPTSVVNSGRGIHVYWTLTRPYSREDWLPVAERLKAACIEYGLEADPVVTADAARILRVPNTHNFKSEPALDVKVLRMAEQHVDLDSFAANLPETLIPVPSARTFTDEDSKDMAAALGEEKYRKVFLKVAKASLSGGGCKQIRRAFLEPDSVSYGDWLHVLSIAKHCEDGAQAIHVVSKGYTGYDPVETEKIASSIDTPHLCMTFEKDNPSGCEGCPHKGKIRTPIKLCMEAKEAESNTVEVPVETPKPMAEGEEAAVEEPVSTKTINIPEYPHPYFRGVNGGVWRRVTDKDGNTDEILIYQRDLYPVKRMRDPISGPCYEFEHHTAREGVATFVASNVQLSGKEEFRKVMAMNDIFVLSKQADELMQYIAVWLEKMRKSVPFIHVRTQFGWTEKRKSFVIGDREVFADKIEPNPPGGRTAQYFPHFEKAGTLEGWKKVIKFYDKPGFEEHQFMFGLSFGSPLMDMIPNVAGGIFHAMSSETGHGKTTGMWGGASVWGNHKRLVLHGKDTPNSAWNRAEIYKNIVLYIDEVSNYKAADASDFVYAISDGEQRNRLSSKGENLERYRGEEWSLNCGTSGNGGLLETISQFRENPKGEAGRVIEANIEQRLFGSEGALQANTLNEDLSSNYGHAGEVYIQHVLQNYVTVQKLLTQVRKEIIVKAGLEAQHRHHAAMASTTYTGLLIAKQIGLIDWDLDGLYSWILEKLRATREGLTDMTIDIRDLISQFYADHPRGILRIRSDAGMDEDMQNILPADSTPMFQWVARHEYDIDKLYILPSKLKEWCVRRGHHYHAIRQLVFKEMRGKPNKIRFGRGTKLKVDSMNVIELYWADAGDRNDEGDAD